MKTLPKLLLPAVALAGLLAGCSSGTAAKEPFSDHKPYSPETYPAPRDGWWMTRNAELAANAAKGAEIAFVGDSITQGWETGGKAVWEARFASHWKCVNLGISGDRTENVLWRLNYGGNLGGGNLKPKVFFILIGTNNAGHRKDSPEKIRNGVKAIVETLHTASPDSKIILSAIFPRGDDGVAPASPKTAAPKNSELVLATNPLLKQLAADTGAIWFDIQDKLAPGGKVTKDIFPDLLHPNAKGYEIWGAELEAVLKTTVK